MASVERDWRPDPLPLKMILSLAIPVPRQPVSESRSQYTHWQRNGSNGRPFVRIKCKETRGKVLRYHKIQR